MKPITATLAILAVSVYASIALALNAGLNMAIKFMPQAAAPVQLTGQLQQGSDYQLQPANYQVQGGTGIK